MHIPDNYLSPSTCAAFGAAMIPVWTMAARKVKQEITNVKMPILGVGAAFSFLIMMFNIPLPGGTTGHAVGGTLLALLAGPWSACISVTIALLIQALLFGDGGILAFGANCFNMAFVLPLVGYATFKLISDRMPGEKGRHLAIAAGSYMGLNAAALCAALEFGIQPLLFTNQAGIPLYCPYPLDVSVPAMIIPHLLAAGIIEAFFTTAIYSFIKRVSPEAIYDGKAFNMKPIYGLTILLIILSPLGLVASGTAWGEWGAEEIKNTVANGQTLNYIPAGMQNGFEFGAILPDYSLAGMPDALIYVLSAMFGVSILLMVFKIARIRTGNKG